MLPFRSSPFQTREVQLLSEYCSENKYVFQSLTCTQRGRSTKIEQNTHTHTHTHTHTQTRRDTAPRNSLEQRFKGGEQAGRARAALLPQVSTLVSSTQAPGWEAISSLLISHSSAQQPVGKTCPLSLHSASGVFSVLSVPTATKIGRAHV